MKGEDVGFLEVFIIFWFKDFGGVLWDIIRGRGIGYIMVGVVEVDILFGFMYLLFSKISEMILKGKVDDE